MSKNSVVDFGDLQLGGNNDNNNNYNSITYAAPMMYCAPHINTNYFAVAYSTYNILNTSVDENGGSSSSSIPTTIDEVARLKEIIGAINSETPRTSGKSYDDILEDFYKYLLPANSYSTPIVETLREAASRKDGSGAKMIQELLKTMAKKLLSLNHITDQNKDKYSNLIKLYTSRLQGIYILGLTQEQVENPGYSATSYDSIISTQGVNKTDFNIDDSYRAVVLQPQEEVVLLYRNQVQHQLQLQQQAQQQQRMQQQTRSIQQQDGGSGVLTESLQLQQPLQQQQPPATLLTSDGRDREGDNNGNLDTSGIEIVGGGSQQQQQQQQQQQSTITPKAAPSSFTFGACFSKIFCCFSCCCSKVAKDSTVDDDTANKGSKLNTKKGESLLDDEDDKEKEGSESSSKNSNKDDKITPNKGSDKSTNNESFVSKCFSKCRGNSSAKLESEDDKEKEGSDNGKDSGSSNRKPFTSLCSGRKDKEDGSDNNSKHSSADGDKEKSGCNWGRILKMNNRRNSNINMNDLGERDSGDIEIV